MGISSLTSVARSHLRPQTSPAERDDRQITCGCRTLKGEITTTFRAAAVGTNVTQENPSDARG